MTWFGSGVAQGNAERAAAAAEGDPLTTPEDRMDVMRDVGTRQKALCLPPEAPCESSGVVVATICKAEVPGLKSAADITVSQLEQIKAAIKAGDYDLSTGKAAK